MEDNLLWIFACCLLCFASWCISVYLGLARSILVYFGLSRTILDYLGLSWTFLGYLGLSLAISSCLELSQLSLAISGYLWLSLAITDYLWISLLSIKYLGTSRNRREQVIDICLKLFASFNKQELTLLKIPCVKLFETPVVDCTCVKLCTC